MNYQSQRNLLLRYKEAYENLRPQEMIKVMKEWKTKFPHIPFRETYNEQIILSKTNTEKKDDQGNYWDDLNR